MTPFIYKPGYLQRPLDLSRCHASVHNDGMSGFHQCSRRPKVERDGILWCKQHDPVEVKAREEAQRVQWQAENEARAAKWREQDRMKALREDCLTAIKAIARGHNDPRTLAFETLSKHNEGLD